jgi:hypothetical protein
VKREEIIIVTTSNNIQIGYIFVIFRLSVCLLVYLTFSQLLRLYSVQREGDYDR